MALPPENPTGRITYEYLGNYLVAAANDDLSGRLNNACIAEFGKDIQEVLGAEEDPETHVVTFNKDVAPTRVRELFMEMI